jgi:hypothetical protein
MIARVLLLGAFVFQAGAQAPPPPSSLSPRLESFSGEVVVTSAAGGQIPVQAGMLLHEADELRTLGAAQAEVIFGTVARIDCDEYSDILFDHLKALPDSGVSFAVRQKSGTCWFKVGLGGIPGLCRIVTPAALVTAEGKAADFLVDVQTDRMSISCMGGTVHADMNGSAEQINLISGQTVVAFTDGRPLQLSRFAPDIGVAERSAQFVSGRNPPGRDTADGGNIGDRRNRPLDVVICAPPYFFGLASIQPDKGVVTIVYLPSRLLVNEYMQGVETLGQAYRYGGAAFVASLLEPLFDIPLVKYCVVSRGTAVQCAELLGNGSSVAGSRQIMKFLSADNQSADEDQGGIEAIFDALFDGLRDRNMALTPSMVSEVLQSMQTNIDAAEFMEVYDRFHSGRGWTRRDVILPAIEKPDREGALYEPDEVRCRQILKNN